MTDFVLRSADQATMYAAFEAQGIYADGVLRTQGLLDDGTAWCLVDQGPRTYVSGYTPDNEPIYTTDVYWVPLRWNGNAPIPSPETGVQIVWQSDAENPGEYPAGVIIFA